jgi:1,4-dihydroxy-2-naphthoate octaprenyltransferase
MNTFNTLRLFIRLARPPLLLIGALSYLLGAGVARYLGVPVDWVVYLLGQAWLILVQFVIHALNEYFEQPVEHRIQSKTLLVESSGVLELGKLPRPLALWASVASALAAGLLTVLIIRSSSDPTEILIVLLILTLAGLIYSIPPLRLSATGYGELILSFFLTAVVPVLAFVLQETELHRLLAMVTFPMVCFFLALLLVVEFPEYAMHVKYNYPNLLLRLGWQRGMGLHNLLVLGGFVLLILAVVFGLPWRIALPILFVIPVGLAQVWLMNRIGQGAKPNWNLLLTVATATYGLSIYFLIYGFWTH